MRKDARIDRKQVICTNASTIGYGKYKAQTGDLIKYREAYADGSFQYRIARVAGRVAFAPALSGDAKPTKDNLLVIALDEMMSSVMERWIEPESVVEILCLNRPAKPPEIGTGGNDESRIAHGDKIRALMAFFLSPEFADYTPDELREWSTSGFASPQEFAEFKVKHTPEHQEED